MLFNNALIIPLTGTHYRSAQTTLHKLRLKIMKYIHINKFTTCRRLLLKRTWKLVNRSRVYFHFHPPELRFNSTLLPLTVVGKPLLASHEAVLLWDEEVSLINLGARAAGLFIY